MYEHCCEPPLLLVQQIQFTTNTNFFVKSTYESNVKGNVADYIRSLSPKYKVCNFDVILHFNENNSTCLILHNGIVDAIDSNSTSNDNIGKIQSNYEASSNEDDLTGLSLKYFTVSEGKEIEFTLPFEENHSSNTQISFQYQKQFDYQSITILCKLNNYLSSNYDLYVVQCDTSSSTGEVFLCYKLCDEDNNMIYL